VLSVLRELKLNVKDANLKKLTIAAIKKMNETKLNGKKMRDAI
jgi:hypothetical protein